MLDPSHPGPIIRDLWMEGRSEAETARRLCLAESDLVNILEGETDLNPQLALRLERIGWSNAAYSIRLPAAFDLAQERLRRSAAV